MDNYEEKKAEFEKAVQPVIKFMQKYCCPHDTIIIELDHAEVKNGEMCCSFELLD